jgi:alanine racemase
VVKADAYGHGLLRAARTLADADGHALLDLNDAVRLREAGSARPILLLEGVFQPADLETVDRCRLSLVLHNFEQIAMLERARLSAPVAVWLKLNTGLNRLGFVGAQARAAYARLQASGNAAGISLITHFADADGAAGVAAQMARFAEWTSGLKAEATLANSAAILRYPESHAAWVRPGIMLYGCSPFAELSAEALGLQPVMTLASEVIAVQELRRHVRSCAADAHRCGRLRLRRRLSAPCAGLARPVHAGPGRRQAHAHRGTRFHGHALRRSEQHSAGRRRQSGDPVG